MTAHPVTPKNHNELLLLSEEEIQDPQSLIENFFVDYALSDLRAMFDKIAETCLTSGEHPFSDARERSDFYYFRKRAGTFFEAVYLLFQRGNEKEPTKVSAHTPIADQDSFLMDLYTMTVDQHAILTKMLSILTDHILPRQKKL